MRGLGHGQVWWADLDKVRPVVVLTRANMAPLLTVRSSPRSPRRFRGISTEVPLYADMGVGERSVASLDNIQLVTVDRLLKLVGQVPDDEWPRFCQAMSDVIAC